MPKMLKAAEILNPSIITDTDGHRYLQMEIYTGHTALNPDGVMLSTKENSLFVKPVYCLIDAPITLCKPDMKTEFLDKPSTPSYIAARVKLPDEPRPVILQFSGGIELAVKD